MNAETATQISTSRKPLDSELDVYGLTHTGLVRSENQDHFLISSLRREIVVHYTSLPPQKRNRPAIGWHFWRWWPTGWGAA